MRKIFGKYSQYGYAIYTADGQELYRAGNSKFNGHDILSPEHRDAINVEILKTYCEWTGHEIARTRKAKWLGCWYTETL